MNSRRARRACPRGAGGIGALIALLTLGSAAPAQSLESATPLSPACSETAADVSAGGHHYTVWDTLRQSMFGKPDPDQKWTPLRAGTLLTEGWFDAWIPPPDGPGGSVRQGWINANDAFFNRNVVGVYTTARGNNGNASEQVGSVIYETPITRRYMFGIVAPVADALQGPGGSTTQFGDILIENRFIVDETPDHTLSFNLNVRTPTGERSGGNSRTVLIPYLALYQDLGLGFAIHGGAGAESVVDDRPDRREATLFATFGLGQTLTKHEVPFFGDFTYYLSTVVRQDVSGMNTTYTSLTPGVRTHLGRNWFLLAGVEVPVVGPQPFHERWIFVLVKGY